MATAFGPGIRALSVYNVNDGTTIQIDGANISPESTIEESKTTRTSAKGNVSKLMTVWELNVQFADPSGFSSLNSADSQTRKWQVVAAGVNGKNLQWYEDSTFIVENSIETDPAADSNFPYTLRMRHISESPAIYNNVNLLAYRGWADGDSNGVADGYTSAGNISTFSADVQTLEKNVGGFAYFGTKVVFPISDVALTISLVITSIGDTIDTPQGEITNFARTQLAAVTNFGAGVGVASDTILTPSNTYRWEADSSATFALVLNNNGSGDTCSIKYPALTTNGTVANTTSFIDY